jgi:CheY-like chemotaxis protein
MREAARGFDAAVTLPPSSQSSDGRGLSSENAYTGTKRARTCVGKGKAHRRSWLCSRFCGGGETYADQTVQVSAIVDVTALDRRSERPPRRIYIVEDHAVVRDWYVSVIGAIDDLVICGLTASARTSLKEIPALKPDLVIIDVSLPDMNGLELVSILRRDYPDIVLVVVSGDDAALHEDTALTNGAASYIDKLDAAAQLLPTLRRVLDLRPG